MHWKNLHVEGTFNGALLFGFDEEHRIEDVSVNGIYVHNGNKVEKFTGENWHLYAPLLQSDMFIQMLNASQEKMQNVVETPDGEFSLYGLKFTKL